MRLRRFQFEKSRTRKWPSVAMRPLLAKGADVNAKDNDGYTALIGVKFQQKYEKRHGNYATW